MKIMIVVGARPNFMKAAPLIAAIEEHNRKHCGHSSGRNSGTEEVIRCILVHTGQHYDKAMSDSFFTDLELRKPDMHLEVGSGSHASQTAEIMRRFERVLLEERADVVVVVGDVNSTVACALVSAKTLFDSNGRRPLIAHVEAGLRSFDRRMPEEINRIVTDHVADLLFVTEKSGAQNLFREGVPKEQIHFVGNTMIDSLLKFKQKADGSTVLNAFGLRRHASGQGAANGLRHYALLTLHRPSNVDCQDTFLNILGGLEELANSVPIIFPAHPRTRKRISEFDLGPYFKTWNQARSESSPIRVEKGIHLVDPLGYLDFLCLMKNATLVLTDSGGIQEETTCLGVPCVTIRENTERPITVERGTNVIAGITGAGIQDAIRQQIKRKAQKEVPRKWDGKAGLRIVDELLRAFTEQRSTPAAP